MAQLIKAHGFFLTNGLERFHGCVKMDGELGYRLPFLPLGQVVLPPSLCFFIGTLPEIHGRKRGVMCRIYSKEVSHEDMFEMNLS